MDLPTSIVPGMVTLSQEELDNSSCIQMKDVTIFSGEGSIMFAQSIKAMHSCTILTLTYS